MTLRQTRVCRKQGPVARELWRLKDCSLRQLYYWNQRTKRYGRLTKPALKVMHDAHESVTGMMTGPNEYWLAETMSEAIEAAEALGL